MTFRFDARTEKGQARVEFRRQQEELLRKLVRDPTRTRIELGNWLHLSPKAIRELAERAGIQLPPANPGRGGG